jgi:hypothetical protein
VVVVGTGPRARDSRKVLRTFRDAKHAIRGEQSYLPAHADGGVDLEKAQDGVSVDAEADYARAAVDLGDRVGGDEAPAAGEKPRPD